MGPKTKAYYARQRAKDQRKKAGEMAQIREEHAAAGDPQAHREAELQSIHGRLKQQGRVLVNTPSDGDCMYHAVLRSVPEGALDGVTTVSALRAAVAEQLVSDVDSYSPFLMGEDGADEGVIDYAKRLTNPAEPVWGGQLELRAIADKFRVQIDVVTAGSVVRIVEAAEAEHWPRCVVVHSESFMALGAHYMATAAAAHAPPRPEGDSEE